MKWIALLALVGTAHASGEEYRVDTVHSSIVLRVDHLGFSRSVARVMRWEADLVFDASTPSQNRVEVQIDAASIDFGDATWNRTMQGARWLNVKSHPEIRFVSKPGGWRDRELRAEKDPAPVELVGTLSLNGVDRDLALAVTPNRVGTHPLTLKRIAGFSARGSFKRSDFGIAASLGDVGDDVEVLIEIEAQLKSERKPGRKR